MAAAADNNEKMQQQQQYRIRASLPPPPLERLDDHEIAELREWLDTTDVGDGQQVFDNYFGIQTADCFALLDAFEPTPLGSDVDVVMAQRAAAHSAPIEDLAYVDPPTAYNIRCQLDARQLNALSYLEQHVYPGRNGAHPLKWPRALVVAMITLDLSLSQIWMLAEFFWLLRCDPYQAAEWFLAWGSFDHGHPILTAKRDLFIHIFKTLDHNLALRGYKRHGGIDDLLVWTHRDLQFERYVPDCTPALYGVAGYLYDHIHESQTSMEIIGPDSRGIARYRHMHGPSECLYDGHLIYPNREDAESWELDGDYYMDPETDNALYHVKETLV
jgi:hypothetical protein